MRIFEALFNRSWPKLSTHTLEKCFENPHFVFCSAFQNLRLGSINLGGYCKMHHAVIILLAKAKQSPGEQPKRHILTFLGSQWDTCSMTLLWILWLPNEDFGRPNEPSGTHFRSTFQWVWVLDLGKETFMLPKRNFSPPKRRFWTVGWTFQNAFSKHFSRAWVLDLGYKSLKSASKTHSETLVRPSQIFVWGA